MLIADICVSPLLSFLYLQTDVATHVVIKDS